MSLPADPSVFDILNLFWHHWFLLRDWLVSLIASAQQTDGSSIDWVKFLPTAHSHLVQCAIKLAPSVPAAKVKQVMFVYILEVLNGDGPALSFFAPCCAHMPCKWRACKPREGGVQPVGAMAVDAPFPVALSQPDPPSPLSPGLMPGNGVLSSEEPAGDGFNVAFGWASSFPGVSLVLSDYMVVSVAPSRPGLSRPPSVLGVKCSPLPTSPSPPSILPDLPSSPPPCPGFHMAQVPPDWQAWIAEHYQLTGSGPHPQDRTTAKDVKGLLLVQVENVGPPSIPTLASAPAAPVALGPPRPFPPSLSLYLNLYRSHLFDAASQLVGFCAEDNVNPSSQWVEVSAFGGNNIMASSSAAPPHNIPHPGWATAPRWD